MIKNLKPATPDKLSLAPKQHKTESNSGNIIQPNRTGPNLIAPDGCNSPRSPKSGLSSAQQLTLTTQQEEQINWTRNQWPRRVFFEIAITFRNLTTQRLTIGHRWRAEEEGGDVWTPSRTLRPSGIASEPGWISWCRVRWERYFSVLLVLRYYSLGPPRTNADLRIRLESPKLDPKWTQIGIKNEENPNWTRNEPKFGLKKRKKRKNPPKKWGLKNLLKQSASRTNLYQVHSAQIEFYQVHSAQISNL